MESLTDRQFEVLIKEYELLLAQTKEFDARLFQIKGWSTAIYSAATGLAIVNDIQLLLLVPIFSCLIFWGLEGLYKNFQYVLIYRTRDVEAIFNNKNKDLENIKVGHISTSFLELDYRFFERIKRVFSKMFLFNVLALYVAKILVLIVIYFSVFYEYA